jgi:hypothetical protein
VARNVARFAGSAGLLAHLTPGDFRRFREELSRSGLVGKCLVESRKPGTLLPGQPTAVVGG